MRRPPVFFYAAHIMICDLQGAPIRLKKLELQLRESLRLRLYCGVKKLPGRPAKAMERATLRFPAVKVKAMWGSISKV